MGRRTRTWTAAAVASFGLAGAGCHTVGTAAMTAAEATADVARAAGGAVATAARGAGRVVRNTLTAADEEI
jgi:hypothetical protein